MRRTSRARCRRNELAISEGERTPSVTARDMTSRGAQKDTAHGCRCFAVGRASSGQAAVRWLWCIWGFPARERYCRSPRISREGHGPLPLEGPIAESAIGSTQHELPLANAMGEFDAGDRDGGVRERFEAGHRCTSALDRAMVLLDDVVQIAARSNLHVAPARVLASKQPQRAATRDVTVKRDLTRYAWSNLHRHGGPGHLRRGVYQEFVEGLGAPGDPGGLESRRVHGEVRLDAGLAANNSQKVGPCVEPPAFTTEWQMPHMAANVVLPFSTSGLGPVAHTAGVTTAAATIERRRYADMDS
jgi:hypothetical protein